MRKGRNNATSIILTVIISLIAIGALFCIATLVYGACTGMTFVEVLESWFVSAPAVSEEVEVVEQTAHLIGM